MSIRGLVFDLDGTLVDSLDDITGNLTHALERFGLPPRDSAWTRRHVGQGAAHLVGQAMDGTAGRDRAEAVLGEFIAHYEAHPCDHTRPYPGVREALAACHARGLVLAVLSNKPAGITVRVIEALGMALYFRFVWGGDSFPERKPSPLPLRHFLAATGLAPAEVLMVGDSAADVQSARAAGVRSAFFPGGYGQLDGPGLAPDYYLSSMNELVPLLDRLERGF
jgi:phosphoglycolate phosphatase